MKSTLAKNSFKRGFAAAAAAFALISGPALAQEPIKIGAFLSVTGGAAFLGDPEQKTLELYVGKINAAGGVLGRKLQLVSYDSAGDSEKARTFVKRLIEQDKVDVIVGGSTTGETMAVIPLVEAAQIPFISLAGAVVITEPVKKWVFKTPQTDRMACEKIFVDMQARKLSKIALISGNGGFDKSMRAECLKVATTHHVEVLADETYGASDTDMTAQLTKIKNSAPQAIITWTIGPVGSIVAKNKAQLGIAIPLFQCHGLPDPKYIELAGKAAEGDRMPATKLMLGDALSSADPQKKVISEFIHLYRDVYKHDKEFPINTHSGYAWDALTIVANAMQKAGTDPKALRAAIEQTKGYVGLSGVYTLTAEDHNGLDVDSLVMVQVKDGKFVPAE